MKPGQSSIYRETELLLEFSVRVTERLPKSLPWQVMGKRLVGNLMDCLDFICLAFQAEEGRKRLDVIDCIIVRMTAVKMVYRQMVNLKHISTRQYADFLGMLHSISTQVGAWRNKQYHVTVGDVANNKRNRQ